MKLTYDIVGSFLRPEAIKNARKDFKEGKITREELTKVEDKEIAALVEKEVAHKLPYVRWRIPKKMVAFRLVKRV